MKKLLLLALTAIMMAGCDGNEKVNSEYVENGFSITTIDSCEYVVGFYKMSHKGNCKFCAERKKQELKELVKCIKEGGEQ